MTCHRFQLPDGSSGFVCTRGARRVRCVGCGELVHDHVLCDWKLTGPKAGKTCDAKICRSCTTSPASDKDLCPAHARAWANHPRNPRAQVVH